MAAIEFLSVGQSPYLLESKFEPNRISRWFRLTFCGPGGFHSSLAHIYRVWRQKTGPLASVTSPSLKTTTALISKSIRQIGQNQFAGKCVNVEELRLVSGAIPLIQHNLCLGSLVFHASSLIILQFVAVVRLWSRPLIVHWSFPSLLY